MTDDELMRRAEEYMDQLMAPRQGEPFAPAATCRILCQKPVPPIDQLESWHKDAIRLGFDLEDVRLVFVTPAAGSRQRGTRSASDGQALRQVAAGANGIQLPGALVDRTNDEMW